MKPDSRPEPSDGSKKYAMKIKSAPKRWIANSFDFLLLTFSFDRSGRGAPQTRMLLIVGVMLVTFILWAALVELDQVVSAQGKAVPYSNLQVIDHYEGGRVEKIYVRSGDKVESGQLLVALSPLQTSGEFNVNRENLGLLTMRLARLNAEYNGRVTFNEPRNMKGEFREYYLSELSLFRDRTSKANANIAQLRSDIESGLAKANSAKARLSATREEFEVTRQLVARGLEPRLTLIRAQSSLAEAEGALKEAEQDLKKAQASLSSTQAQRQEEILGELTKIRSEITQTNESLLVSADKADRMDIKSPIAGTVNRVLVSTPGETIRPGDAVAEVVPADSRLIIETNVLPQDIGFVARGQNALIKFSAYDFSIFGPMVGVVDIVGSDAVDVGKNGETAYVVKLAMNGPYIGTNGQELPVLPGMQAQVDIITGKRTLMNYIFSPFTKAIQTSFREK